MTLNNKAIAGQDSLYVSSVTDSVKKEIIIKVVNASGKDQPVNMKIAGAKKLSASATISVMQSDDLYSINSFENPTNISPKESVIPVKNKAINYPIPSYSFSVIKIKM